MVKSHHHSWRTFAELFEVRQVQRNVNLLDLVKNFPTSIYLQKSASIQPRTSFSKFGGKFNSLFIRLLTHHHLHLQDIITVSCNKSLSLCYLQWLTSACYDTAENCPLKYTKLADKWIDEGHSADAGFHVGALCSHVCAWPWRKPNDQHCLPLDDPDLQLISNIFTYFTETKRNIDIIIFFKIRASPFLLRVDLCFASTQDQKILSITTGSRLEMSIITRSKIAVPDGASAQGRTCVDLEELR